VKEATNVEKCPFLQRQLANFTYTVASVAVIAG